MGVHRCSVLGQSRQGQIKTSEGKWNLQNKTGNKLEITTRVQKHRNDKHFPPSTDVSDLFPFPLQCFHIDLVQIPLLVLTHVYIHHLLTFFFIHWPFTASTNHVQIASCSRGRVRELKFYIFVVTGCQTAPTVCVKMQGHV